MRAMAASEGDVLVRDRTYENEHVDNVDKRKQAPLFLAQRDDSRHACPVTEVSGHIWQGELALQSTPKDGTKGSIRTADHHEDSEDDESCMQQDTRRFIERSS